MSSYDNMRTDPALENKGVWVEYGELKVLLARAGGANQHYNRIMDRRIKPIRRAMDLGQVSVEASVRIVREVFAETVILGWKVRDPKDPTKWINGVEDPDTGEILKPGKAAYEKVLAHEDLRDLFQFIQQDASGQALYLRELRAVEAKN